MSLKELGFDAAERLRKAAIAGGALAGDVQDTIDALESQAVEGSPKLASTIGKAAAMLAELEA